MASRIEEITGVPVVTIEYDGTAGIKNEDIIPYLKYRKKKNIMGTEYTIVRFVMDIFMMEKKSRWLEEAIQPCLLSNSCQSM